MISGDLLPHMASSQDITFYFWARYVIYNIKEHVLQVRFVFGDALKHVEAHNDAINFTPDKARDC